MNLLRDLEELLKLAQQMQHMASMAPGLAERGELKALEELTLQRKRMASRSRALMNRLAPAFERWEESLEGLGEAQAQRCWALAGQVEEAFKQALKADAQLREILGRQLKDTQAELNRLKHTGQALRAYQEAAGRGGVRQG